jgi:hypothetical protein
VRSNPVCELEKCEPSVGVVDLVVVGVPPSDDPPSLVVRRGPNACRNFVFLSLNFFRMLSDSLCIGLRQQYHDGRNGARARVKGRRVMSRSRGQHAPRLKPGA